MMATTPSSSIRVNAARRDRARSIGFAITVRLLFVARAEHGRVEVRQVVGRRPDQASPDLRVEAAARPEYAVIPGADDLVSVLVLRFGRHDAAHHFVVRAHAERTAI